MELWKNIKGYKTLYQVSNTGKVLSLRTNKLLKPIDSYGYKYVHLCNNNHIRTNKAIHRLVAEAFISNPKNLSEVNHIDGDKSNNNVTNLEWCTRKYNANHRINVLNKSNKRKVYCIETKQTFNSIKEASNYYHKSQSCLVAVLKGYKYNKTFDNKHWVYVI